MKWLVTGAIAALSVSCGAPASCESRIESLLRAYSEAKRAIDRTCTVDADCALVSEDLGCVGLGLTAVNVSAVDAFEELRKSYSAKCDGTCKAAYDSFQTLEVSRCRQGFCRAEARGDGG